LKVVEISAFVAAPLAGATLASLGAEVVRIDPPGGGIDIGRWPLHQGRSLYWAGLNQGKASVAIDTHTPEGQELAGALIASAGMLITNLPVAHWNSYEHLKQLRQDLIMAVLTGNPDGSPAVDYTVNAALGFPMVTGPESWRGPVNHVIPVWDALSGQLLVIGLIAAELHRTRTGDGQLIQLSLADTALSISSHLGFIAEAQLNPVPRHRYGNYLFGSYSRDFRTADGKYVLVVALTPRQWDNLVQATELKDQIDHISDSRSLDLRREGVRFEAREAISAVLETWFGERSYGEVRQALDAGGVLWSPYHTFQELVRDDPRCSTENPMFREVDQPGIGRYLRSGSPLRFESATNLEANRSPVFGEHTASILHRWLSLGPRELEVLARRGIIGGAEF
jgi:2-methylfumaryl-CoA isomerase